MVNHASDFVSGGGDSFGRTVFGAHAPVETAEGTLRTTSTLSGELQDLPSG
jgi:hypothetical protein